MTCEHCCFACTAKGIDMSWDTFHKAIGIAKEYEQPVTLGGGEPTIHPKFKEFILHAQWELAGVSNRGGMPFVGVITNGTNTDVALTLAMLAEVGAISASVSHDEYHDTSMVNERVYKAFEKPKTSYYNNNSRNEYDHRGVNGPGSSVIAAGRAKNWGHNPFVKCVCDSLFITPRGLVYPCGCKKEALGHVSDATLPISYEHFEGRCESDPHYKEKMHGEDEMASLAAIGGEVDGIKL